MYEPTRRTGFLVGTTAADGVYFRWSGTPEEELIAIFMTQIIPHRTRMREDFRVLTYQAIAD